MQIMEALSTADVAAMAGVHRDTLLRWLRSSVIPEPRRDHRGWRIFTQAEAQNVLNFVRQGTIESETSSDSRIASLSQIDWDFTEAKTTYLTHGIHPYPAKFIPQISNNLIQELSSVGDTVADIFCGSGTTLLESLLLRRHAIGIDANPLAALISRAKTVILTETDFSVLSTHLDSLSEFASALSSGEGDLFYKGKTFLSKGWRPEQSVLDFWFDPLVVEELAEIRDKIIKLPAINAKDVALTCFSSIIVSVSKQDSDTRYVRREKEIGPGDVVKRYVQQLRAAIYAHRELADIIDPTYVAKVVCSDLLKRPEMQTCDLVVCSPPYPNAYSYHLYHRSRLLWLGYNPEIFKAEEIGSHRKYSSRGPKRATEKTFQSEFIQILKWLRLWLKDERYACFVVGDSTLNGQVIDNATLIADAGTMCGFRKVARLERNILASRKSFNPTIGKIRSEKILILQKRSS
jgi:hypothetical protein